MFASSRWLGKMSGKALTLAHGQLAGSAPAQVQLVKPAPVRQPLEGAAEPFCRFSRLRRIQAGQAMTRVSRQLAGPVEARWAVLAVARQRMRGAGGRLVAFAGWRRGETGATLSQADRLVDGVVFTKDPLVDPTAIQQRTQGVGGPCFAWRHRKLDRFVQRQLERTDSGRADGQLAGPEAVPQPAHDAVGLGVYRPRAVLILRLRHRLRSRSRCQAGKLSRRRSARWGRVGGLRLARTGIVVRDRRIGGGRGAAVAPDGVDHVERGKGEANLLF
ncbi:hypothetical protein [Ralstonia solanacearum]|uniref:hypothetical protein n=1 Tax=Ralstonia solanacearum TaxID=305 RepID=UPI001E453D63|nr:hypothetical protein [Ralstonia solanacearum]